LYPTFSLSVGQVLSSVYDDFLYLMTAFHQIMSKESGT
jgi:hypothetical protein